MLPELILNWTFAGYKSILDSPDGQVVELWLPIPLFHVAVGLIISTYGLVMFFTMGTLIYPPTRFARFDMSELNLKGFKIQSLRKQKDQKFVFVNYYVLTICLT